MSATTTPSPLLTLQAAGALTAARFHSYGVRSPASTGASDAGTAAGVAAEAGRVIAPARGSAAATTTPTTREMRRVGTGLAFGTREPPEAGPGAGGPPHRLRVPGSPVRRR